MFAGAQFEDSQGAFALFLDLHQITKLACDFVMVIREENPFAQRGLAIQPGFNVGDLFSGHAANVGNKSGPVTDLVCGNDDFGHGAPCWAPAVSGWRGLPPGGMITGLET